MCEGGKGPAEETCCDVCGNEAPAAVIRCPFCGAQRSGFPPRADQSPYRTLNLEKGMPTVDQALRRLRAEIASAAIRGSRILILIHGYGSSGEGGAIKGEVRRLLEGMQKKRQINEFLPGEECDLRRGRGRQMVRRFPFLKTYLRKTNPGISIVIV